MFTPVMIDSWIKGPPPARAGLYLVQGQTGDVVVAIIEWYEYDHGGGFRISFDGDSDDYAPTMNPFTPVGVIIQHLGPISIPPVIRSG